jgi:hypothetical protein
LLKLVADETGLGKTFTLVAAVLLRKVVTENDVMGLPRSILWWNTLQEWVILAHIDFLSIFGKKQN